MRTFSQADWQGALQAWADGDFSPEWKEVRHQAAMRGILYPPEGTKWDSWEDDSPSQRAMLIRAIRETPKLLTQSVARSRSWGDVIANLLKARDDWRAEQYAAERDDAERRDDPDHKQAVMSIADILHRIGDSL